MKGGARRGGEERGGERRQRREGWGGEGRGFREGRERRVLARGGLACRMATNLASLSFGREESIGTDATN